LNLDPGIFELLKFPLAEILLICLLCGMLGPFVVNYRMAFFSDAISHSAFTGVALGLLLGIDPLVTIIAFGILMGLLVIFLGKRTGASYDTIIGVIFAFSVSIGIFLVSSTKNIFANFRSFLYGDILLVGPKDLLITAILFAVILAFLVSNFDNLVLIGVDESYAETSVKNLQLLKYAFSFFLALVVTVSIKSVGILLVSAILIVPAASARVVSRSMTRMFYLSILFSLASGLFGTYLSLLANASTGASIVLASCGIFVGATLARGMFR